jgi:Bacterial regulatory helix-turn-helix protein, lysR family
VEIRDLEYFLACCETRNFTAAARPVHIVQSAMSAAIARLEQEVGASLFDRSVTPVVITEHGAAAEIADYTLMTKLVRAGFGTTLMPASAINGIDSGTLAVPVDDARLRWSPSAAIDRAEWR